MRKRSRITGVFLLLFGAMVLIASLSKQRVQTLHGADVVALVAAGVCFGVALIGLIGWLKPGSE